MTVRVTTLKGADAGAHYVEQVPNYYLQSGEPRGMWFGNGADQLGLAGEIGDDDFLAVMGGMDPQRPDRHLGRRYDDQSVRGFDVTASAPKSVSVLFALGSPHVRGHVLAAHDAAVDAMAGWIERHAHTRYRIGGEVAPSANAAEVLARETGLVTDTLDKLLIEHRLPRSPRPQFDLPVGTTVIVDEAGMVPTARLAELAELADVKGWRIALVGDPLQFSAVGRGGMFGLLVDTFGAIELERVHRFEHEWERAASLRLRRGDVTVTDDYDTHGRLRGGTVDQMERAAVARWATCRAEGKTVTLMAPTNEAVERLNQRCQRDRIRRGELDDSAGLAAGPYMLHVGDEIATRQNDRRLVTDRGEIVRNRSTWTIDEILPDGSIGVTGRNGRIDLPAAYVAKHVELAYARTAMGAQGSTVDLGMVLIDKPTDVRNLYVAMTRGRESNEALVVTTGEQTAADVLAHCIATDWIDRPALARRAELRGEAIHRPGLLDVDRLREAIVERHILRTTLDQARATIRAADVTIADAKSAVSASRAQLAECIDALTSAADILDRYDRPLHRRRNAPEIARAQRAVESIPGAIEQSRTAVRVDELHLDEVSERITNARAVVANADRYDAAIAGLDDTLGADLRVRERVARTERPTVVIELIGERPLARPASDGWDAAAGQIAQHQAALSVEVGDWTWPMRAQANRAAFHDSYARVESAMRRLADFDTPTSRRGAQGISIGL